MPRLPFDAPMIPPKTDEPFALIQCFGEVEAIYPPMFYPNGTTTHFFVAFNTDVQIMIPERMMRSFCFKVRAQVPSALQCPVCAGSGIAVPRMLLATGNACAHCLGSGIKPPRDGEKEDA